MQSRAPRVTVVGSGPSAVTLIDAVRPLPVRTRVVDPSDAGRADGEIVILATGPAQIADDNLLVAAARSAPSVAWIVRRLDEVAPRAILLVATPPVALTTRIAIDLSSRETARIIGVPELDDVAAVLASIVFDDGAVHPVCTPAPRAYGVGEVVLNLPCEIDRGGIRDRLIVDRTPSEQLGLAVTAATLRAAYDTLVGGTAIA
jgi:malate/lactate dehydrogenase